METDLKQTLEFSSEAVVVPSKREGDTISSIIPRAGIIDNREHTIKDFLSRPYKLWTGVFTTSQTRGQIINTFRLPDVMINTSMYKEKIQGFAGFRADVVLRLQANAQRFQAGRLMLHYFPQASTDPIRLFMANQFVSSKSQQPRVDLDLSTDQEVEIVIPYSSPLQYLDLNRSLGTIADAFITVYSPLMSSSSTSVDLTLWAWFTNIELVVPSDPYLTFTSQSGNRVKSRVSRRRRVFNEEEEDQAFKMSTLAETLSMSASQVSKIPLLKTVSEPVGWALDWISNVAKAWGWSKVDNHSVTSRMVQNICAFSQNVDGISNSVELGFTSKPRLQQLDNSGGTALDEMAISYICAVPSYISAFTWTTSTARDTPLFFFPMTPYNKSNNINVATVNGSRTLYSLAPMSYIANMFALWKGSLIATFKFVKTEFHTGRVELIYMPGTDNVTPVFSNNGEYLLREVFDLRLSNEFCIRLPYISPKLFLSKDEVCGWIYLRVLNELEAPSSVPSSIDVIMELSGGPDLQFQMPSDPSHLPILYDNRPVGRPAPEDLHNHNNASTVDFIEELIKLGPQNPKYNPFFKAYPEYKSIRNSFHFELGKRMSDGYTSEIDIKVAQKLFLEWCDTAFTKEVFDIQGLGAGETIEDGKQQSCGVPKTIGGFIISDDEVSSNAYSIGEKISSLRQLLKRHSLRMRVASTLLAANDGIGIFPSDIFMSVISTTIYKAYDGTLICDYFNYFGPLFKLQRGSIKLNLYRDSKFTDGTTQSAGTMRAIVLHARRVQNNFVYDKVVSNPWTACPAIVNTTTNQSLEVAVTNYGRNPQYINYQNFGSDYFGAPVNGTTYDDRRFVQFHWTNTTSDTLLCRSAGDDFSFSLFVGTPTTMIIPTGVNEALRPFY